MAPEPDQTCSICCRQLQLTDRVCLPNKPAIFQISSAQYFQYSSRQSPSGSHVFHGEIMYAYSTVARSPSKYAVFVPLSLSRTEFCKFRENTEIQRKWANSAARLKILRSAENCGP